MTAVESALGCRVLVLNRHYMAIRVVPVKRAFSLLFRDLAEVVSLEDGRYTNYDFESWVEVSELKREFEPDAYDWIHTVRLSIAVPRIVRLLFYDRLPQRQVTYEWAEVDVGDSPPVLRPDADGPRIGDASLTSVTRNVIVHTASQSGEEGRFSVVAPARDEGNAARDHQASNRARVGSNQFSGERGGGIQG